MSKALGPLYKSLTEDSYGRVLCMNKFLWRNSHSYIRVLWKTLPEESYGIILLEESYVGTPM